MCKDDIFYDKWTLIRKKGRLIYTLSRGFFYGIIIYSVWVPVTLIFDRNKFDTNAFQLRFIYYGIIDPYPL